MVGSGTKPELPDEFWEQAFRDFFTLKFRRKPGRYDDALEAAEEPIWDSYQHDIPNTSYSPDPPLREPEKEAHLFS